MRERLVTKRIGLCCRSLFAFAAAMLVATVSNLPAQAMEIQRIVSDKGIEAWLVEDHSLPLIAVNFAFRGGSAQDPDGKQGLANFVSGMLDEGAGDMTGEAFRTRLEELAVKLEFDASRDSFTGRFRTLSKNREEGFALLRLALGAPRMDADAAERIREQILARIKIDSEDPEKVSVEEWFRLAFADHPYAHPVNGTAGSVAAITADDLKGFVARCFARDSLKVAVVGDIDGETLKQALDQVFGDLPARAEMQPVPEVVWRAAPERKVIPMKLPQSVVSFGHEGFKRKDKDFIPAYILNYIIGGGGFASKLMEEVREKRGLAYSVYTYLYPLDHAGILLGGVATENKAVAKSLEVIETELKKIAEHGPGEADLESAKRYLTGSYALRFDGSTRIAGVLLAIQLEELGIDYVDKRNALVEAVTLEDIRRVARRLIQPGNLVITVVGEPEGLTSEPAAAVPGTPG